MISLNWLQKGGLQMLQNASMLSRIEQQFGVPGAVIVAIWGLETDFGVNIGKIPTIRALATLAYDCRRSELFQGELLSALRIIDRGDLAPGEMRGAWAGELGQHSSCPLPTSSSVWILMATAGLTCCVAHPTCWPRRRTISRVMAGKLVNRGCRMSQTSTSS